MKYMHQGACKPVDSEGRLPVVQPKEYMKKLDGEILLGIIEATFAQIGRLTLVDKEN